MITMMKFSTCLFGWSVIYKIFLTLNNIRKNEFSVTIRLQISRGVIDENCSLILHRTSVTLEIDTLFFYQLFSFCKI